MKHLYFLAFALTTGGAANAQIIFQNDFESWAGGLPTGWYGVKSNISADSVQQETVNPQLGSSACRLINSTSTHKRFTTGPVEVTDGQNYDINFWVRGTGNIRTGLFDGRSSGSGYATYNTYYAATSTWTEVTQSISAANDTTQAEFILSVQSTGGPDHIVVDNVTISIGGAPTLQSIYDIQYTTDPGGASPAAGSSVITGGIVTAAWASGFWMQSGTGPWTGIYVNGTNDPDIGDSVIFTANVEEYFSLTRLTNVSGYMVMSSGEPVPAVSTISTADANTEPWESVLCRVTSATCTALPDAFMQWKVNDGSGDVFVDDLIYAYTPVLGTDYNVTGPVNYSFSEWKLEPRDANDIEIFNSVGEIGAPVVQLMPNPANDLVTVEMDRGGLTEFKLSDASGRIAFAGRENTERFVLDVSAIANGVYTLTLTNGTRSRSERIVVQH